MRTELATKQRSEARQPPDGRGSGEPGEPMDSAPRAARAIVFGLALVMPLWGVLGALVYVAVRWLR